MCAPCAGTGVVPFRIERSVPACPKSGGLEGASTGMDVSSAVSGSCGVGCGYPSILKPFRSSGWEFGWYDGCGYDACFWGGGIGAK